MYGDDSDKMEALLGTGMNSNSLNPQYSWLCYADVVREGEELRAKVWEFKKMVRDLLNKLAMSEDGDEPIEIDPFTDPDEGVPVLVKYLKKPNKKKGEQYYEVTLGKKPKARPLTDEELEYFATLKPISEVTRRYNMSEFDKAIDGLKNFDEDNDFNLFDNDDWLEIVEEVKQQYDSDSEDEQPKKKTSKKVVEDDDEEEVKPKKSVKKSEPEEDDDSEDETEDEPEEEETEDGDEFDDMDRTALKKYIKEKELEIVVKKSMSDDDLREAIRAEVNSGDDSEDETEDEPEEEEVEEPKKKLSLEEVRKKLKKG